MYESNPLIIINLRIKITTKKQFLIFVLLNQLSMK